MESSCHLVRLSSPFVTLWACLYHLCRDHAEQQTLPIHSLTLYVPLAKKNHSHSQACSQDLYTGHISESGTGHTQHQSHSHHSAFFLTFGMGRIGTSRRGLFLNIVMKVTMGECCHSLCPLKGIVNWWRTADRKLRLEKARVKENEIWDLLAIYCHLTIVP